jgi:hypothetical protein
MQDTELSYPLVGAASYSLIAHLVIPTENLLFLVSNYLLTMV